MPQKPFVLPSGVDFYAGDGTAAGAADPLLVVSDSTNKVGINSQTPSGTLDINTASATDKGLIVRGSTSQSADILEIQDSLSNPLFTVDSAGKVGIITVTPTGTLDITTASSSTKGLILRATTSQSVNLLEYTDPTGAIYGYINSFGEYQPVGSLINKVGMFAIGNFAGRLVSSSGDPWGSDYSTFIGYSAGYNANNASFGMYIGQNAGRNSIGFYSTFIGTEAGYSATPGAKSSCVMVGTSAGYTAGGTTYSMGGTTLVGYLTGGGILSNIDNATMIGAGAGNASSGTNNLFVGSSAGRQWRGNTNIIVSQRVSDFPIITGNRSVMIGLVGGSDDSVYVGYTRGVADGPKGTGNVIIGGSTAGSASAGHLVRANYNILIGNTVSTYYAPDTLYAHGSGLLGSFNIDIAPANAYSNISTSFGSELATNINLSYKLNIARTIRGDISTKQVSIGNASLSPTATLDIVSNSASRKGVIIQGAAAQTANYLEIQNSSSVILSSIDSLGQISGVALNVASGITIPSGIPAVTTSKLYASGTTLYFNGATVGGGGGGNPNSYVSGVGVVGWVPYFNTLSGIAISSGQSVYLGTVISPNTTTKTLITKAIASQSVNIFEVQNSSGSGLFTIDQSGGVNFAPWSGTSTSPVKYDGVNNRLVFTGSGAAASGINLNVLNDSTLSFESTAGQLFSISDGLASGTIFSVNDISGMSSIEVDASGLIKLGEYDGFIGIGTSQTFGQYSGKMEINAPSGYKGLIVRNSTGSTGNLFEAQSSASGALVVIDASGEIGINNSSPAAMLDIASRAATVKGIIIKNAVSQSANIFEVQNSSSTPLAYIDSSGSYSGNLYYLGTGIFTNGIVIGDATTASGRINNQNNSIFIGQSAGASSSGTATANGNKQIFIGQQAGSGSSIVGAGTKSDIIIGFNAGASAVNLGSVIAIGNSAMASSSSAGALAIGPDAFNLSSGCGASIGIGNKSFNLSSGSSASIAMGFQSAYNSVDLRQSCIIGFQAGQQASGQYNTYIGAFAGYQNSGNYNIEIPNPINASGINLFLTGSNSNKINLGQVIVGDMSTRRLAIGNVSSSNLSPSSVVEIIPQNATDKVLIVKSAISQTANLFEVQNSSSIPLLAITPSGAISGAIAPTILTTTTGITLTDSYNGYIIEYNSNNSGTMTLTTSGNITIPSWNCSVVQIGTGIVTVTANGNTLRSPGSLIKARTQYSSLSLYRRGTGDFVLGGDLA